MDTVRNVLMSYLVKILVPESPAYGNTLPFAREESIEEIITTLEVGDIIFTRTNNSWYELCRKFLNTQYDHVSVVINKHEVIHISPPIISKIEISCMIAPSREPLIVRLPLEPGQKESMISLLMNFIGEKYNQSAIPSMFKNELFSRMLQAQKQHQFSFQGLKYSKICTEAILYALGKAEPDFIPHMEKIAKGSRSYQNLGFVLPDDALKILRECEGEIIYKSPEFSSRTLIERMQGGLQTVSGKLSEMAPKITNLKSQGGLILSQIGNSASRMLLHEQPIYRILNIALILFELKYGQNTFNKLMFFYSVMATIMVFRAVPSDHALKGVFKRLAKL